MIYTYNVTIESSKRHKIIFTFLLVDALIVFILLPVRYQELYSCKSTEAGTPCLALYSTEVNNSQFVAIRDHYSGDYEGIGPDTQRNALVFLVPLAYLLIVVPRSRKF